MKRLIAVFSLSLLFFAGCNFTASDLGTNMKITSPAFADLSEMPAEYTCQGEDINPPLEISGVPDNAQSLVLVVLDPDAGNWVHWLRYGIDPDTKKIEENGEVSLSGTYGMTSFRDASRPAEGVKYHGPCPPTGQHRYEFRLYALDFDIGQTMFTMTPEWSTIENVMDGHIIDQAVLTGVFGK